MATLQFRRGSAYSGSSVSEPFYNTTDNTLLIGTGSTGYITLVKIGTNSGSVEFTGDITGSNLRLSGDITARDFNGRDIRLSGTIYLGDEVADNIVTTGQFSGSLIPSASEVYDLGSDVNKWGELHVSSAFIDNVNLPGSRIMSSSLGTYQDFDSISSSLDSRLDNLNLYTQSTDLRLDDLEWTGSNHESRIDEIETTFSSSVDSRLDLLENFSSSEYQLDSASFDSRLDYVETTFSTSVDLRLDDLESTGSDHELRIDEIETTFSSSVDSRLDLLENFSSSEYQTDSSSFDSRLDSLEFFSSSEYQTDSASFDDRIDDLKNITGSYATTGSNTFIGNQTITGSLLVSGSTVTFEGLSWPETGSETHLFKTEPYTLNIQSGDRNYGYLGVALEHFEESPSYLHNSLNIYTYDNHQNPNYGSEFNVGPLRTHMRVLASGSRHLGNISVQDNQSGNTVALMYADGIQIGVVTGSLIQIGNDNSSNIIRGVNTIYDITTFLGPVTASSGVTSSFYLGDGSGLTFHGTGIVSSSQQIDVNNTQNFQNYSASIDSRLNDLNDYSQSNNQRVDSLESYTSSLKQSIGVNGADLIVLGNLTVQGTQTSLNTTETFIEDRTLTLASGSANGAEANGSGIVIDFVSSSILWNTPLYRWDIVGSVSASAFIGDGSQLENVTAVSVDFYDITNKPTLVSGSDQVTSSLDNRYLEILGDNVVSGSSQIDVEQTQNFQTYSSSVDSRFNNLTDYSQSNNQRIDALELFTESIDIRVGDLESFSASLDLEYLNTNGDNVVSSSNQLTQSFDNRYLEILGDGVLSGSSQVTESLDNRYLKVFGDSVISSSQQVIDLLPIGTVSGSSQVTESLDLRYEPIGSGTNTLISSSIVSTNEQGSFTASVNGVDTNINLGLREGDSPTFSNISLHSMNQLGGGELNAVFSGSAGQLGTRTLGTAAFFNVSASVGDDPNSIPTNKAVSDALVAAGAGDITAVNDTSLYSSTTTGLVHTGQGTPTNGFYGQQGNIVIAIDTGSQHFIDGVNGVVQLGDGILSSSEQISNYGVFAELNGDNLVSSSNQINNLIVGTLFSESVDSRLDGLELFSSSLDGDYVTEVELGAATSSLINLIDTKLNTSSFNSYTQSTDLRLDNLELFSSSLDGDYVTQLELASATGSLINSIATKLDTGSYNTDSQSFDSRLDSQEVFSSSIDTTIKNKMNLDGVISGSSQIIGGSGILSSSVQDFDTFSSSVDLRLDSQESFSSSINDVIKTKMNLDEVLSGSAQLTGSFVTLDTDQTISGTKTFNDIVVNGTGSFAYIESVGGTAKIIGDSFVVVNTATPTSRYSGLSVYDSGSTLSTASFYFDGETNDWGYEYSSSAGVDYAVTIFGPEYSTKGNPTYLTSNRIPKAVDNHHLNDSNISDSGTLITLGSNVQVNGNISLSGTVDGIDLQNFSSSVDGRLDTLEETSNENPLTFSDTTTIDFNRVGDTITADIINGSVSNTKLTNSSITINGTSVSLGGTRTLVTDDIAEDGSPTNLWFTTARARGAFSAGTGITITNGEIASSGVVTATFSSPSQGTLDTVINGNTESIDLGLQTGDTVQFAKLGVGGASDATYELKVTGDIGATGDVVAYVSSDQRLKDEITPIENSLQKINQIGGYSFVWNENQHIYKGKDYGVIAQEIEQILPELVETRENGYKAVKYDRIVSLLIEGIKELTNEVTELKKKLEN